MMTRSLVPIASLPSSERLFAGATDLSSPSFVSPVDLPNRSTFEKSLNEEQARKSVAQPEDVDDITVSSQVMLRLDDGVEKLADASASSSDGDELLASRGGFDIEHDRDPQFVGHLNPEGLFLAIKRLGFLGASNMDDTLGFWLPIRHDKMFIDMTEEVDSQLSPTNEGEIGAGAADAGVMDKVKIGGISNTGKEHMNQPPLSSCSKFPNSSRALSPPSMRKHLEILPKPQSYNALRAIFFRCFHPIFPIIRSDSVPETTTPDSLSLKETILAQTLCLAVATDTAARPFLRF